MNLFFLLCRRGMSTGDSTVGSIQIGDFSEEMRGIAAVRSNYGDILSESANSR